MGFVYSNGKRSLGWYYFAAFLRYLIVPQGNAQWKQEFVLTFYTSFSPESQFGYSN